MDTGDYLIVLSNAQCVREMMYVYYQLNYQPVGHTVEEKKRYIKDWYELSKSSTVKCSPMFRKLVEKKLQKSLAEAEEKLDPMIIKRTLENSALMIAERTKKDLESVTKVAGAVTGGTMSAFLKSKAIVESLIKTKETEGKIDEDQSDTSTKDESS